MIKLLFFFMIVWTSTLANAQVLEALKILNVGRSKVESHGLQCLVSGRDTSIDAKAQLVCEGIASVIPNIDSSPSFRDSEKKTICEATWQSRTPPWSGIKSYETYSTNDYVLPSRKSKLAAGFSVASPAQELEILRQAETIRGKMALACCGRGAPDCLKAMTKIPVEICQSSEADQNPEAADPCQWSNAAFIFTKEMALQIAANLLRRAMKREDLTSAQRTWFHDVIADNKLPLPKNGILGGEVILSPYVKDNKSEIDEVVLWHEFTHACSFVRKQVDALTKSSTSIVSIQSLFNKAAGNCELDPTQKDVYSEVLRNIDHGSALAACLFELANSSTDVQSSAYTDHSCPLQKLEEGTAIAVSLMLSSDAIRNDWFRQICWGVDDTAHPRTDHVFECVMQSSPTTRQVFLRRLNCQEVE